MNPNPTKVSSPIDIAALEVVLTDLITAGKNDSLPREKLFDDFLPKLVAATHSLAAAVLFQQSGLPVGVVSQLGWNTLTTQALKQVRDELESSSASRFPQTRLVTNRSATRTFIGRTARIDGGEFIFVLVRPSDSDALVEHLLADLVQEIAVEIENYELRRSASNQSQVVVELTHLVQLTQNVAKAKNVQQLAVHLVNDLAKTTGAGRVSFFNSSGRLLSISGVSSTANTQLTRAMSQIAKTVAKTRQASQWTGSAGAIAAPDPSPGLSSLFEILESETSCFLPVQVDDRCCGVVAFEYFQTNPSGRSRIDQQKLVSRAVDFVAPVVDRALLVQMTPGFNLLDRLFNRWIKKPVRLAITLLILGLLATAAGYVLFFVERPFEIQAEGKLQPKIRRNLYAPENGEVRSLAVADSQTVGSGQSLLMIESQDLTDQQIAVEGELAEIDKKLNNLMIADLQSGLSTGQDANRSSANEQSQFASEVEQLRLRKTTLEKRLSLLTLRTQSLNILAPIAGQITTPDVEQRLRNRPVNRGDWLLSISDLSGEWEIELEVPDNRMEFIQNSSSQSVKFRIIAHSDQVFEGKIRDFDFTVKPTETSVQRYVSVLVDLNEDELRDALRYGSRVLAKIDCGRESNWFLLTYEIRQKFREWWFW